MLGDLCEEITKTQTSDNIEKLNNNQKFIHFIKTLIKKNYFK